MCHTWEIMDMCHTWEIMDVSHVGDNGNPKRIKLSSPEGTKRGGRPEMKWEREVE